MCDALLFAGTRWPAAKVVARKKVVDSDLEHSGRQVPLVDTLIIETTGLGRPYVVDHVEGWWRDLAEFRLDDERRVLSFLQRRGDPFGKLKSDGTQIFHLRLARPQEGARTGGGSMGPATGRDRRVALPPEEAQQGRAHVRMVTGRSADGPRTRPRRGRMGRGAQRFLCGGITRTLPRQNTRRLPVRRCRRFGARGPRYAPLRLLLARWFTLHHSDARWCSSSCRAAASNKRRSPHGFVSQDQNT